MSLLEQLSVDHPYYCNEGNYYSNEPNKQWETMTEFLDEFENADIDMNWCFRWDITPRGEGDEGRKSGRYSAQICLMYQRKGIYSPHLILHVNGAEAERFMKYAEKHWAYTKEVWAPLSNPTQDKGEV